jgi:hypothetical protein
MTFLALEIYMHTFEYELGGLDRLKSCGAGSFEDLPLRSLFLHVSRATLASGVPSLVHVLAIATRQGVSLGPILARGCAIWLVVWVRVYKRFSSVTLHILAGLGILVSKTLIKPASITDHIAHPLEYM